MQRDIGVGRKVRDGKGRGGGTVPGSHVGPAAVLEGFDATAVVGTGSRPDIQAVNRPEALEPGVRLTTILQSDVINQQLCLRRGIRARVPLVEIEE